MFTIKQALLFIFTLIAIWVGIGFIKKWCNSRIYKLELEHPNPREFVFAKPLNVIDDTLSKLANLKSGFKKLAYKAFELEQKDGVYHCESTTSQVPNYLSYTYRYVKDNKPAIQVIKFNIYLNEFSPDSTQVIVVSSENTLCYGVKLWRNLGYTQEVPICKDIPSTTIEEYEMLRYIGKLLGELDRMPLVNYPKALSRKEILHTFGSNNPFTYKEMFGEEPK